MNEVFFAALLSVIDPAQVLISVVGGITVGAALDRIHPRHIAGVRYAKLMTAFVALLGLFFYAGRIAYSASANDPITGRIVGSYLLWLVFSAGAGLTTLVVERSRFTVDSTSNEEARGQ